MVHKDDADGGDSTMPASLLLTVGAEHSVTQGQGAQGRMEKPVGCVGPWASPSMAGCAVQLLHGACGWCPQLPPVVGQAAVGQPTVGTGESMVGQGSWLVG